MSKFRKQHMSVPWHDIIEDDSRIPAAEANLKEKATLVGRVGIMMLSVGTGAWRVRASMNKISRALGITCSADIGLNSIECTCIDPESSETVTNVLSLDEAGVNTDKLNSLESFADNFHDRAAKYSVSELHSILDKINAKPGNYNALKLGLAAGFACFAFTFLLGGGPIEMICAFFGAGVGNFVRREMIQRKITLVANVAVSVFAACCVYVGLIKLIELILGVSMVHQVGYICSMLFVIPGFPLITGGIDLAKLDIRSGIERISYALIIILTACLTAWVAALAFRFSPGDFADLPINSVTTLILRIIMSFIGVFGFSLMFNSTKQMAFTAGIIGCIANTVRLELIDFTGISTGIAAFIGALLAGLMASAIKPFEGFPRITLTVPSIVIMVPGLFMYKSIYYIGQGNIEDGGIWLVRAALIVLALPLGLIFARILTDNNFRKKS